MLSFNDAVDAVKGLCAPEADPALSDAEVQDAVERTATARAWTLSTVYAVGDRVVPNPAMGRVFICTLAGTSGAVAPSWLIAPDYTGPVNPLAGSNWWGVGVVPFVENVSSTPWFWGLADGSCAWRDFGPFIGELYDVRAAAAECWRTKARKAVGRVDVSISGGVSPRESQIYDQCMRAAMALQPMRVF